MEKTIKISTGKEFVVKEIKYKEFVSSINTNDNSNETNSKMLLKLSTGITDEEFENLSLKDGVLLTKEVNNINGLSEDFQNPQ